MPTPATPAANRLESDAPRIPSAAGPIGLESPAGASTGICVGATGSIGRLSGGRAVPVIGGLPSVSSTGGADASGPAAVVLRGSRLGFVVQDTDVTGRLLVLEIDRLGLSQPTGGGELIRVNADRSETVLSDRGLHSPTGLAVGPDGSIYISNYGSSPSTGPPPHGEILRLPPG